MSQLKMKKILVVDNDPLLLNVLQEIFTLEGYNVFTAQSGLLALKLAQQHRPDLIISDWTLTDLSGVALFYMLRNQNTTRNTAFLLLTSYQDILGIRRWMGLPSHQIIAKPFHITHLLDSIQKTFNLSQASIAS